MLDVANRFDDHYHLALDFHQHSKYLWLQLHYQTYMARTHTHTHTRVIVTGNPVECGIKTSVKTLKKKKRESSQMLGLNKKNVQPQSSTAISYFINFPKLYKLVANTLVNGKKYVRMAKRYSNVRKQGVSFQLPCACNPK